MKNGLLLIDKHDGCTSHDVVASARRILRQKKIGHCGTLDPTATGLLLLTVGRATRLTRFLIRAPKVYEGTVRLGVATDSYDMSGEVKSESPTDGVTAAAIGEAMQGFIGSYMQQPPPYCAKKVGGVKFYELARRGEEVPEIKKEVTVYDLHALGDWKPGEDIRFQLACSSGTYARSIAHELGEKLGCGGALASLRRTKIGHFDLADALDLESLRARLESDEDAGAAWIPFDEIPLPFGDVVLDTQQEKRIQNGQTVLVRDLEGKEGDWIKMMSPELRFIAVGAVIERIGTGQVGVIQPKVVFQ